MITSGKLTLTLDVKSSVVRDLSTVVDPLLLNIVKTITNGTGSNQATKTYGDTRTLVTATSENIELETFGGAPSAVGELFTNTRVVAIVIQNKSATMTLAIGGEGSANEWTAIPDVINLPPGGILFLYNPAGFTVGATNKLLKINNAGGSDADYDIAVVCS